MPIATSVPNTPFANADAAEKTDEMRDALPQIAGATSYLRRRSAPSGSSPISWTWRSTSRTSTLIGFAIAVDYSMLVVFRFREELARQESVDEALVTTMRTAGRAAFFSGAVVAIGLALLVFMPLPFMRSMGVGGLLVPLFSIAAAATFLPALLSVTGRRINRLRVVPKRVLAARADGRPGFWTRLSRSIMRRPVLCLVGSSAVMLALAVPALGLALTGGDNRGVPLTTESTQGLALLQRTLGPGALAPHQMAVDTGRPGGALRPETLAAQRRLVAALRADPEVKGQTLQAPALLPQTPAGQRAARSANLAGCRSSGSGCRRRSCWTRRSCERCSCRRS